MLQIKIVVESQRLQLVSLKTISTSIKQNQIAQALYIPFLNNALLCYLWNLTEFSISNELVVQCKEEKIRPPV